MPTAQERIAILDYQQRRRKIFAQYQPQIEELHQEMLRALLAIDAEFYRQYPHLAGNGQVVEAMEPGVKV